MGRRSNLPATNDRPDREKREYQGHALPGEVVAAAAEAGGRPSIAMPSPEPVIFDLRLPASRWRWRE